MFIITEIDPSIRAMVDENDGHCPCAIWRSEDTLCPCREFREMQSAGACTCGRFEKAEVEL